MGEKDKPGKPSTDEGKEIKGAETGTGGRTLSATPSLAERQSRLRDTDLSVPVGGKFGDYQILKLLGKGGMGEVYEAEHLESGRRLALKVLSQPLRSPEDQSRFLQEGRLAAQVNHPNCIYVYGSEEILGIPVITMELAPGGTFKDLLKKEGRLSPEKAVDLILQVVNGLEAMHSVGVLHRDIKPSNCFIDAEGNAKIGDFGLSISTLARSDYDVATCGSFAGTPAFASPEQILGGELDVRSDIYSVGATLYSMLTGNVPFDEPDLMKLVSRILEKTPDSPRSVREEVPKGLAGIVMRCLEKKASGRFSSYSDLRRALQPFSSAAWEPAGLGLRMSARLLDLAILAGLLFLIGSVLDAFSLNGEENFLYVGGFLFLLYFTVLEGLLGTTVGKTLRKIRVIGPERTVPGVPRSLLRALIFFILVIVVGRLAGEQLRNLPLGEGLQENRFIISTLFYPSLACLLFATARRRNGHAGIHDLMSGTRVVTILPVRDETEELSFETISLPETRHSMGPYVVMESLRKAPDDELILGYDDKLKRKIWIHVRPPGTVPLPESRHDISRPGRLRWINGKRTPEMSWDAYEAPEGKPFLRHASKRSSWARVRIWLAEIIEEIGIGLEEESLPSLMGLGQIWITAKGRVKLFDFSAPDLDPKMKLPDPVEISGVPESLRAMRELLKQAALSALEGVPRGLDDARRGVPSIPLPLQARSFIETLNVKKETDLAELAGLLRSWIGQPDLLSKLRLKRLGTVLLSLSMLAALDVFALLPRAESLQSLLGWSISLAYLGILSSLSAFANRGSFLLKAMNFAVVGSDGSPVSRRRAFLRSLIGWSPMIILGLLPSIWNRALVLDPLAPDKIIGLTIPLWPSLFLLGIAFAGAVWSVVTPERGPHDRIAGTYLVPR